MTDAFELVVRLLCDNIPRIPVDGAYLYCTTLDNQQSVFKAARKMISSRLTKRILIFQADPMGGYPGGDQCRSGLEAIGVPASHICEVPGGAVSSINTLIESQEMVRFAKEQGIATLMVVSPPFHQLRAFMTAVTVALGEYPELKIYSHPGVALPWMDTVAHSQGTLQAPRRQLIQEELSRIETYQKKGDLACYDAVLGYINQRDG